MTIAISNSMAVLTKETRVIKLRLIEDDEVHFISHEDGDEIEGWYRFID